MLILSSSLCYSFRDYLISKEETENQIKRFQIWPSLYKQIFVQLIGNQLLWSLGCVFPRFMPVHFRLKPVCSPTELGERQPFLCTEQGSPFSPVFRHIRLQYIINDLASARILERDNIIPPGKDLCTQISAASL